jgi:histidyl-tRNA synthetase
MERLEILSGKSGEESDKLTFRVMKRGAELERALEEVRRGAAPDELADLGLRYEFTVSLARVMAQYGDRLPKPFKRYQMGPVWRADRPQHGRYREFIQCDVDIVGTDSRLADAELIVLMTDVFEELGLNDVQIHINHRELLRAIARACGNPPEKFTDFCIALDKLDKEGNEGVLEAMRQRGLSQDMAEPLSAFLAFAAAVTLEDAINLERNVRVLIGDNSVGIQAIDAVKDIVASSSRLGAPEDRVVFDPTLARGLDYYTGPVFEAVLPQAGVGSLGGGGRYDELIGMFSGRKIPATGTSFGLERIVDLMLERGLLPTSRSVAQVSVLQLAAGDEAVEFAGVILKFLHNAGVSCEVSYHVDVKLAKHIQAAVRRGNSFVVFIGSDELGEYEKMKGGALEELPITAKRLADGVQRRLSLAEFAQWLLSE